MPSKPKTYKPPHAQTARQRRADFDRQRAQDPATVERRKLYGSKAWKDLRMLKLTSDPTCEYCAARGRLTPAREVDHYLAVVERPDLVLDYDNLRSACTPCHSSKTRAERSGRPWRGHDIKGLPLDPRHPWRRELDARGAPSTLTGSSALPSPSSNSHAGGPGSEIGGDK